MIKKDDKMYRAEVVSVLGLNKTSKAIRLRPTDGATRNNFAFEPGQFVILSVLGYGEAIVGITTAPAELPEFEVAVKSVGNATQALHRLKAGDIVYFRGPMGNSILSRNLIGKHLLLVGGGIGVFPLRSLIHVIRDDSRLVGKLTVLFGAKDPEDLVFKNELPSWSKFADVHLTVNAADRDWTGEVGLIPKILKKLEIDRDAVAIVCGPPAMYREVAKILLDKGLSGENIEFMLERRMRCGIGKCQHCTCGGKYVCLDGPTFTWTELADNWEFI